MFRECVGAGRLETCCKRIRRKEQWLYPSMQLRTRAGHPPRQVDCWPPQVRPSWQTLLSDPTSSYPGSHRKWTSWPTLFDLPSFLPFMGASSFGQVPVVIVMSNLKHLILPFNTFNIIKINQFFSLLMVLVECFPVLLCSRFIFFFRLRRLCK